MISEKDIQRACGLVAGNVVRTPTYFSKKFSQRLHCSLFLKLENLQFTGSFKDRGATNKIASLTETQKAKGVIAASAGNHAQGVAYLSKRLGVRTMVVMPRCTPLIKILATQNHGAEVILHGDTYDDANLHARKLAQEGGLVMVHPFNDPLVIAGQGTIGKELLDEDGCPDMEVLLCPVGGGGLIAGVACYLKEKRPDIRVIGVEAEACPSMQRSLEHAKPVQLEHAYSIADGIAVKQVGDLPFRMIRHYVDEIVTVEEDEIANAVLQFLEVEKLVVEGAGAVALAAMLHHKVDVTGRKAVAIVSGGNMDVMMLNRIICRGLNKEGRIVEVKLRLRDQPGCLNEALSTIRKLETNILDIIHHRFETSAPLGYVDVSISLETRNLEHIRKIRDVLHKTGYLI